MSALPYKEFREDGFPLCPRCGEDELYPPGLAHHPECDKLPVILLMAYDMRCGYCNWNSDERERER